MVIGKMEHTAYDLVTIAAKLPLDVTAVDAQDNALYAATSTKNALLIYKPTSDNLTSFDVNMCREIVRKPVIAMYSLRYRSDILLLLTADGLTVNHVKTSVVTRSKGASMCAVHSSRDGTARLALAVRRRIHIFNLTAGSFDFLECVDVDVQLSDNVTAIEWCGERMICVATRDEYYAVAVGQDEFEQATEATPTQSAAASAYGLFMSTISSTTPGGENYAPVSLFTPSVRCARQQMVHVEKSDTCALLVNDAVITICIKFVNISQLGERPRVDSQPIFGDKLNEVTFSAAPIHFVTSLAYIMALLPSNVIEVRASSSSECIQRISLPACKIEAKMMCAMPNGCGAYISSANDVYLLNGGERLMGNIERLVKDHRFELAIQLANSQPRTRPCVSDIRRSYAVHSFSTGKYSEAFDLCVLIGCDVVYTIGLVPTMLPETTRATLQYPLPVVDSLPQAKMREALLALSKYLAEVRTRLAFSLQRNRPLNMDEVEREMTEEEIIDCRTQLSIVDTTLLKCYLQTNDMMVASLLRLSDNSCNLAEAEKLLRQKGKTYELFLLYERREMHAAALDLLQGEAGDEKSRLAGVEKTVTYLQQLGNKHIDLIMKHCGWVLKKDMEEGLRIFIDDSPECKGLNREKVLAVLTRECPKAIVPYLEHVITDWHDESPRLHAALADHYVRNVKDGLANVVRRLGHGQQMPPLGKEPMGIGQMRLKLVEFLETSKLYESEAVLAQLPPDSMFEERAVVLGRAGEHLQALSIYVCVLRDEAKAEKYCAQHYDSADPVASKVYANLQSLYASPQSSAVLPHGSSFNTARPNVPAALRLLHRHADKLDPVASMQHLDDSTMLKAVWPTVESVLQQTSNISRQSSMLLAACRAASSRAARELRVVQSQTTRVDSTSKCAKCSEMIANSAFVLYPHDGHLLHYYCYKRITERK